MDAKLPADWGVLPTPLPVNREDKRWYVKYGELLERRFIEEIVPQLHLPIRLNPAKWEDRFVPDLLYGDTLADLKHQNIPFFTSRRYGVSPQFAVTYNRKDYERYQRYPDLTIFWWIERVAKTVSYGAVVKPMNAVWGVKASEMAKRIDSGAVALHQYQKRQQDTSGNGKSSYVFDVRDFELLWHA